MTTATLPPVKILTRADFFGSDARPTPIGSHCRHCHHPAIADCFKGYTVAEYPDLPGHLYECACPNLTRSAQTAAESKRTLWDDLFPLPLRCDKAKIVHPEIRRWFNSDPLTKNLIIWSTANHTGKTFSAVGILNEARKLKQSVLFAPTVRLLGRIQDTYTEGAELTAMEIIDHLSSVKILVLDDLGKNRGTEHAENALYDIVNARFQANLPTVVTTNFSMADLAKTDRSTAIASRLTHDCAHVRMDKTFAPSKPKTQDDDGFKF